jgi:NAD(P)-dependent dehydrogenase (short-subunit alcohol dehydrogenase family)
VSQSAVYAATKAGLIALSKNMARTFGPDGITVNAIAPGAIDTPMVASQEARDPGFRRRVVAQVPVGRFADAREVAGLIRFLASDDAAFINGATIDINGGWFMY